MDWDGNQFDNLFGDCCRRTTAIYRYQKILELVCYLMLAIMDCVQMECVRIIYMKFATFH